MTYLLRKKRLPALRIDPGVDQLPVKRIRADRWDLYWQSDQALGRELLLEVLVGEAKSLGWCGDYDNAWADWDLKLVGDRWHGILIRTATEELGWPDRFTRARCSVRLTSYARILTAASLVWSLLALVSFEPWALMVGLMACVLALASIIRSRSRCLRAVTALVANVAGRMEIDSIDAAQMATSQAQTIDRDSTKSVQFGRTAVATELTSGHMEPTDVVTSALRDGKV